MRSGVGSELLSWVNIRPNWLRWIEPALLLSCDAKQNHTDNRYDPRKVGPAAFTGVSPRGTPHAH